eukprot:1157779-Pelagomonas_calceolata.AAC.5
MIAHAGAKHLSRPCWTQKQLQQHGSSADAKRQRAGGARWTTQSGSAAHREGGNDRCGGAQVPCVVLLCAELCGVVPCSAVLHSAAQVLSWHNVHSGKEAPRKFPCKAGPLCWLQATAWCGRRLLFAWVEVLSLILQLHVWKTSLDRSKVAAVYL